MTKIDNQKGSIKNLLTPIAFIMVFTLTLVASGLLSGFVAPRYKQLSYGCLGSILAFSLVWLLARKEKIALTSLGLAWQKGTPIRFILGMVIGLGAFLLVFLPLLGFSSIVVTPLPFQLTTETAMLFASILPLALMEEIGFRSYPQFMLNKHFGIWTSQLLIAVLFGCYHLLNGWSVLLAFAGPAVWAIVFGLAALWSKGIAVPTGIHFVLNVMQHLCGLKNKGGALMKLDYAKETAQSAVAVDSLGLWLQLGILAIALVATGYYKKARSTVNLTR
jgi:hypothetical protein